MKKVILFLSILFSTYYSFAQNPDRSNLNETVSDPNDIVCYVYLVEDADAFPSSAFSLASSDAYIQQSKNWIESDRTRYENLINESSTATKIAVKSSEIKKMSADKQEEFKPWTNEIAVFLQSQVVYQTSGTPKYIVSKEDFKKFQYYFSK